MGTPGFQPAALIATVLLAPGVAAPIWYQPFARSMMVTLPVPRWLASTVFTCRAREVLFTTVMSPWPPSARIWPWLVLKIRPSRVMSPPEVSVLVTKIRSVEAW